MNFQVVNLPDDLSNNNVTFDALRLLSDELSQFLLRVSKTLNIDFDVIISEVRNHNSIFLLLLH